MAILRDGELTDAEILEYVTGEHGAAADRAYERAVLADEGVVVAAWQVRAAMAALALPGDPVETRFNVLLLALADAGTSHDFVQLSQ